MPSSCDAQLAIPIVGFEEVKHGDNIVACGSESLARIVYGTQMVKESVLDEIFFCHVCREKDETRTAACNLFFAYLVAPFISLMSACSSRGWCMHIMTVLLSPHCTLFLTNVFSKTFSSLSLRGVYYGGAGASGCAFGTASLQYSVTKSSGWQWQVVIRYVRESIKAGCGRYIYIERER